MIKEQMSKLKNMFKGEEGSNKKKIENLVVFVIILIVTIIVINMVLKEDDVLENTQINNTKTLAKSNKQTLEVLDEEDNLKEDLEEILAKIEGVGKVKVLITYSETSQIMALYNEDNTQSDTEEQDSGGGNRKISETSTKKEVIYQEIDGEKVPVTQSTVKPKIEGAIITATGAGNSDVKIKITQAVEAATGLATHKIQVFEMVS